MKATEVTAGLAESNGSLLPGIWRDSLHVTCGLTACTPGSAPGPTLGNEYGKTLPYFTCILTYFFICLFTYFLTHLQTHLLILLYLCILVSRGATNKCSSVSAYRPQLAFKTLEINDILRTRGQHAAKTTNTGGSTITDPPTPDPNCRDFCTSNAQHFAALSQNQQNSADLRAFASF